MIAENLLDLITKVTSIEALATSSGLALGGKGSDPGLQKLPLPAAWIMYAKDDVDEDPIGHGNAHSPGMVPAVQALSVLISILIYIPYTTQDDLLNVQLPLLETVIKTIRGTDAPSGHRWRYLGQKLALVYPDRIAYEQHYTLTAVM